MDFSLRSRNGTPTKVAYGLAAVRALTGAGFIATPTRRTEVWMGEDAGRTGARMAIRGIGARDIALSLGHVRAVRSGGPSTHWALAGAMSDAGDFLATLASARSLPAKRVAFGAASAGAAAAVGAWLATTDH